MIRALPALCAVLVALACAGALIRLAGAAPLDVYLLLLDGTWHSAYGAGQVLFKATPLIFAGLAVAVPYRAGLFNVGGEGQAVLGGLLCGLAGAALPPSLPRALAIPLALSAAFAGGALAGAIPGLLKAWRGAHEVIVTIMLNFVVLALASDAGKRLFLRETVHTRAIVAAAELPRASAILPALRGAALNAALLVALLAALAVWWLFARSVAGFRLRAVGLGREAAEAAGIPVARMQLAALALGGGLAGLCGANFVMGYKHYYEEGFSGGVGFMGIAAALLGRNHPGGIVLAALLLGTLSQGGLAINAVVPKELVEVLQAVIILAVAVVAAVAVRPATARTATATDAAAAR